MTNKRRIFLLLLTACLLLSCNLLTSPTTQAPSVQEPPINVETSVSRTRAFDFAVRTAAAGGQTAPTSQIVPATSQPPAPTTEPTLGVPIVSVSVDTNCREGPATIYKDISYLLVGKTSEVTAKYKNGQWWVIKDPNNPNKRCWLWGYYATVTGPWQQLQEATQPPTPTITLSVEPTFTSLNPPTYTGICPTPLNGAGTITVNMPVTVTYIFERSAGPNLGSGSLTFAAAGTQNISFSINFLSTSTDTVRIHVTSPIDVSSDPLTYNILCTPY